MGTQNRVDPLARCLKSIAIQRYSNMEVIVLDDASDTDIKRQMGVWAATPRIEWLRSHEPSGVAGARNKLIKAAGGEVLVFLDDDAYFEHEHCVERAVDCFDASPRTGIVAFRITLREPDSVGLQVPFSRRRRRKDPGLTERRGSASYFVGAAHAISREVFDSSGLYQDNLVYGHEELDLSYAAIQQGFEIVYTPDVAVSHAPARSVIQGGELFYNTRNRIWVAYKHLPRRYVMSYVTMWMAYYGLTALRHGRFLTYFRGVIAGLTGLSRLTRRPLDAKAVSYLKSNFGRLWY